MRKFTKEEVKKLKKYWKEVKKIEEDFDFAIRLLENRMQKNLKIKDLEFFWNDGYCGIGNISRTIKLLDSEKLEE